MQIRLITVVYYRHPRSLMWGPWIRTFSNITAINAINVFF